MSPPIALFDADRSAGESLREYLTRMGLEVQLLHDPQQAIALGREAAAKLFIVAVGPGMDEAAVCQALKEGTDPPAVIALCERAGLEQQLPAQARPDEVFIKPIPFARLLHAAERLLGEAAAQQQGDKDPLAFPRLLVELWRGGRSGVLRLAVEGLQTTIYLKQGVPVFAEHGSLGDTLGRMLVDTGRITGEQFAKAVDLITERLVDNEQLRLGEALVELGILTAEEVMEALRDQVQRKIVAFFGREQFHHDFEEGEEQLEAVGDFAKPMERLLMAGIKSQVSPQRLDRFLDPLAGKYPVAQASAHELATSFGMTPQEHAFLDGVNGERSIQQLRELSKLDRVHASQLVAVLVLAGTVRLSDNPASKVTEVAAPPAQEFDREETPPPKESRLRSLVMAAYLRIKGRTDQEVLDIQEGASQEEIEDAYQKRLRQFNEGIDPGAGKEVRQKATDIVNHLTAARDRLLSGQPAPAPTRPPRNETQAMLQADREFQRGKQLLQLGQWASAGEFFRRAAQLQPKVDEYQMFSEWMSYLAAKEKDKRKTLRERVERFARRVLKQTPEGHPKAYLILGKLAAEAKDRKKAEEHLQRAAELDPDDIDIKRELRLLDLRRQRRW